MFFVCGCMVVNKHPSSQKDFNEIRSCKCKYLMKNVRYYCRCHRGGWLASSGKIYSLTKSLTLQTKLGINVIYWKGVSEYLSRHRLLDVERDCSWMCHEIMFGVRKSAKTCQWWSTWINACTNASARRGFTRLRDRDADLACCTPHCLGWSK